NKFNPWSSGLKDRPLVVMPSITAPPRVSVVPSIVGSTIGAIGSEGANKIITEELKSKDEK
ncbi:hypothetical protein, partial [Proteus terrae]